MMSQACARWRGDIGAYLVDALDLDRRAEVRRHMQACAACRADYEDLLPVLGWLSRLARRRAPAFAERCTVRERHHRSFGKN
jgi:anti-sigma factor RsiW